MDDENSDSNGLLSYIASTVETMHDQMATKDDLAGLATKDDLAGLATRDDLRQVELRLTTEITAVRGDVDKSSSDLPLSKKR